MSHLLQGPNYLSLVSLPAWIAWAFPSTVAGSTSHALRRIPSTSAGIATTKAPLQALEEFSVDKRLMVYLRDMSDAHPRLQPGCGLAAILRFDEASV